jgi:hypothetical protein
MELFSECGLCLKSYGHALLIGPTERPEPVLYESNSRSCGAGIRMCGRLPCALDRSREFVTGEVSLSV